MGDFVKYGALAAGAFFTGGALLAALGPLAAGGAAAGAAAGAAGGAAGGAAAAGAAAAGTAAAAGGAAAAGSTVLGMTASQLAAAGAASTALGSTVATQQAAGAAQVQLKLQQRQEELAATDREVQRQRRLNSILGSQAAEAAAGGIAMSGSVANISLKDATRASEDSQVDRLNTSMRINALRSERRAVGQAAWIKSAGTLLSAGQRYARRG